MPIETRSPPAKALAGAGAGELLRRLRLPERGIRAGHRRLFTERLALLLEADVPLHTALRSLREQSADPRMTALLTELQEDVTGGKQLSVALARHPAAFPKSYINFVAAGEGGGYLHRALTQLVALEERQEALRATLFGALSYPGFLILFSIAVVVFVLIVVFPKFGSLFESIREQLPATTLALMATSDFLRAYWHLTTVAAAGFVALALVWGRTPQGSAVIDRLALRLPVVKDLLVQTYMARTMRVMSASLASGVTVPDTLAACREVVRNNEFQAFIVRVQTQVADGRGVAAGFRESKLVPNLVRQMIETGEQTGKLALVTDRIAEFYERALTKRIRALAKIAEPVMLLVMGVLVGLIVSSLILPIFKLSKVVH